MAAHISLVSDAPASGRSTPVRGGLSRRDLAARRVTGAVDAERRRIERDLHDGLQQRLTALKIRLSTAAVRFDGWGDTEASAAFEELAAEAGKAIDELREIAHGVYPAVLASGGLVPAVRSACVRAPHGATLVVEDVGRYGLEVETAVYFTCLAALDNAATHSGAVTVTVHVWDSGDALHCSVVDTGCGFDPEHARLGLGIASMRDRMASVGGRLAVDSAHGRGARVHATVPL